MNRQVMAKNKFKQLGLVLMLCGGVLPIQAQDEVEAPPLPELLDLEGLEQHELTQSIEIDEQTMSFPEEGITIIDLPEESSMSEAESIPEDLFEDIPPPVLEDDEVVVKEPEPTFEDLLTPEIQQTEAVKAIQKTRKARKKALKSLNDDIERLSLRQEVFSLKQQHAQLKLEQVSARAEKLDLKRSEVEEKLADPDITPEKREELEARLARIIERETRVQDKLLKLETKIEKLAKNLDKAQSKLLALGGVIPDEENDSSTEESPQG